MLLLTNNEQLYEVIKVLAMGPWDLASRFSGYIIDGVRYHTKIRELRLKTQNNGIMLKATTSSYSSAKDINPREGDVAYYGKLIDIVEYYYSHYHRYVLFKCEWIDNNSGLIAQDEFGFTLVNFKHLLYKNEHASNEPFILASQAQQIFYVQDPVEEDWNIVIKMKPRDLYDMCESLTIDNDDVHPFEVEGYGEQELDEMTNTCNEDINWVREDVSDEKDMDE